MNLNAVGNVSFPSFIQQLTEELKAKENSDSIWTTNQSTSDAANFSGINTLLPNNLSAENQLLPLILLVFQAILGKDSSEQEQQNVAPNANSNINLADFLSLLIGNAAQPAATVPQTISAKPAATVAQTAPPRQSSHAINNNSVAANNPEYIESEYEYEILGKKMKLRAGDNGRQQILDGKLKLPQGDNVTITYDGNTEIRTNKYGDGRKNVYTTKTDENGNTITTVKHIGKTGGFNVDPNNSKVTSITEYVNGKPIKSTSHRGSKEYVYNDDGSVARNSYDKNGVITSTRTERPVGEDGLYASITDKYEDGKLIKQQESIGAGGNYKGDANIRMGVIKDHEKGTTYVHKSETDGKTRTCKNETYDANGNLRKFTDLKTEYKDKGSYFVKSHKHLTSEFNEAGELDAFKIVERISGGIIEIEYKDGEMIKKEYKYEKTGDGNEVKRVLKNESEVSSAEQIELKAEMSKKPESSLKDELKDKSELLNENEEALAAVEEAEEEAVASAQEAQEKAETSAQEASKDDSSTKDKISANISAITDD